VRGEPFVSHYVACGVLPKVMGDAVHLDRNQSRAALEIQDVRPDRVLATEFEAVRALAEDTPQENLRKRHRASERAGACTHHQPGFSSK
jgi:hypothetical protein